MSLKSIHIFSTFDGEGRFQEALGVPSNDINLIMSRGNVIRFKRQYSNGQVAEELRALLGQ